MRTARSPEEVRRMIEDALEEIERTELEMLDLLSEVLGADNARRVADEIAAQGSASRLRRLVESRRRTEDGDTTPQRDSDRTEADRPS